MNPKFYKEQARVALNEHKKVFALCMLIMTLFSAPSLAARLVEVTNPMLNAFLFAIESVISVCFISVLQYSFSKMSLKVLHKENVEISQLFDGFKIYGKVICKTLIEVVLMFIGMLFFIIPGIILNYSLAMSDFLLADNPDLSVSEAIEESYEMMKGHRLELFVLDLSFAGWFLLEFLTLGLLSLWVTPYHRISHAAFYDGLKKETLNKESSEASYEQNSVYNYASPDIPVDFDSVTNETPLVCDKSKNDE